MALETVTLKWDVTDLIQAGIEATLSITPTAELVDTTDHVTVGVITRSVRFGHGTGQLAGIIANDSAAIEPGNAGYLIQVATDAGVTVVAAFTTQILFADGAVQWLDELVEVPSLAAGMQYLPLPSGTPAAGQVPIATGAGEASAWGPVSGAGVTSVFGRTGVVTAHSGDYTAAQVGADASGAAAAALATAESFATSAVGTETTRAEAAEVLLAPLASPGLTGTPTAPTKTALTNSTAIATTAYADAAVAVEVARAGAAEALALPKAGGTMAGALVPAVVALTDGSSIAVNAALGNTFAVTLGGNRTLANPSNPADGQVIRVRVTQDGSGSRTLAYGTAYDFGTAGSPTLSTAAAKVDILGFEYVAALAKWCYLGSGLGF